MALSENDHWKLRKVVEAKYVPARVKLRAHILLGAAAGLSNHELARRFSVSRPTVMKWRRHYEKQGMDGLLVSRAPSGGRRAALRKELEIVNFTLGTYPLYGLGWTVHEVARQLHIRRDTVQRTWKAYKITRKMLEGVRAEWDFESLILSSDPLFGARITAVAGLFYSTPDPALALVVDPREPWVEPERLDGDLFAFEPDAVEKLAAALQALDGVWVWSRQPVEDMLVYLNRLEEKVPAEYDVHLVMRLYQGGVHREAAVREWLAGHPRFWPHFMPRKMWHWGRYAERWLELIKASERKMAVAGMKETTALVKAWVGKMEGRKEIEGALCVALKGW